MTKQLTQEELDYIKRLQENSPIVRYLKYKDRLNFGVGDFLIKRHRRGDKWETETISHISNQPKRFICIFEDEYGIKYIRPLTSVGRELPYIIPITEITDFTRYELDPDYADHIILSDGENFDFSEKRKKDKAAREAITRKNRKISEKAWNEDQVDAIFRSMKPGDFFWMGWTIPEAACSKKLEFVDMTATKNSGYGSYRPNTYIISFIEHEPGYPPQTKTMKSEDFKQRVIFRTEPFPYETI